MQKMRGLSASKNKKLIGQMAIDRENRAMDEKVTVKAVFNAIHNFGNSLTFEDKRKSGSPTGPSNRNKYYSGIS